MIDLLAGAVALYQEMSSRARKIVAVVLAVVLAIVVTGGIVAYNVLVPERSTEAFCAQLAKEKQQYLAKYNKQTGDGFGSFVNAVGAMSALEPMFARLATRAPDEIQTNVEIIRDTIREAISISANSAGDPFGGLAAAYYVATRAGDSWNAVDGFVRTHCDGRPAATTSTPASPTHDSDGNQAQIDAAEQALSTASANLYSMVYPKPDTTYADIFRSVDESSAQAKEALGRLRRDAAHPSPSDCASKQYSTMASDRAEVHDAADSAKVAEANLTTALVSPDQLADQIQAVKDAQGALADLGPSDLQVELANSKATLVAAEPMVEQIRTANETAKSKLAGKIRVVTGYAKTADKVFAGAC